MVAPFVGQAVRARDDFSSLRGAEMCCSKRPSRPADPRVSVATNASSYHTAASGRAKKSVSSMMDRVTKCVNGDCGLTQERASSPFLISSLIKNKILTPDR